MSRYTQHITHINDLMDISELQKEEVRELSPEKLQKHIRANGRELHLESGMREYKEPIYFEKFSQPAPQGGQDGQVGQVSLNNTLSSEGGNHQVSGRNNIVDNLHCRDIAEHIENCPICSKLHNTDKTIYILIIVFLAIVCILLLKRVLEL